MQRIYNNFTAWVQQDDFFTNWPNFIEHKNIDGLRDGYGVTLWPKMNKLFTTWSESIRAIYLEQNYTWTLNESYVWWDNGVIYRMNATDDTPTHTLASGRNIVAIESIGSDLYFFCKDNLSNFNILVEKISKFDANNDNWDQIVDNFIVLGDNLGSQWMPPIFNDWWTLITTGSGNTLKKIDNAWITDTYDFPSDDVVWITQQWATVMVYQANWYVNMWDWASQTRQWVKDLKTRISKVGSDWNMDYITTEDGAFYIWSGLSFQRVTKPRRSKRMNDNTSFDTRLSFSQDDFSGTRWTQNRIIQNAISDIYMYSNDTIKGVYKYGTLIPWMQPWLHKIITENHAWTPIDYIYDMYFYERTLRRLYIAYKAGNTYGVDYIDLDSLETCSDGYLITEVFSWGTSFKKWLDRMRRATTNTAWNNFIKLYYRVNNGSWILIRDVNDATDEIERENMKWEADTSPFQDFVDVQLKIELHNDDGSENAPTLHELMLEYEVKET